MVDREGDFVILTLIGVAKIDKNNVFFSVSSYFLFV